jgi:hypothetical protein
LEHEVTTSDIITTMVERLACRIILLLTVAVVACQQSEELPTLAPTLAPVSASETGVVSQRFTPAPATSAPVEPTVTFTPSATPVVLTPQPTSLAGPGVNITSPGEGSQIELGSEVIIGGLVQSGADQTFLVTLVSATGHMLAQAQPQVNDFNSWSAVLTVPHSVSGAAEIRANLLDKDETVVTGDVLPVMLQVVGENTDRYLILDRPLQVEEVVAGYNIFFDGLAQRPADNLVTISLWNDACQNRVAKQSFRLHGSGYWQGFVVVPADASGQLCAVAHFGDPGEDAWREAQVVVEVLDPNDEQAMSVLIGNPPPESELTPGKTLLLYGTAYNAPDREVLISILLENGRLLTEGVAAADIFGYWELELYIPADAAGPAQIEASLGERGSDEFVQSKITVNIGGQ